MSDQVITLLREIRDGIAGTKRYGISAEPALRAPIRPPNTNDIQKTRWRTVFGPVGTIPGSGSTAQKCSVPGFLITASYITAANDIALVYFEDPDAVRDATPIPLTNGGVIRCPEGFTRFWIRAMFTLTLTQACVTVGLHPDCEIAPGAPTDVLVRSGSIAVSGTVGVQQTPTVTDHGEVAVASATRVLIATIGVANGFAKFRTEVTKETSSSTTPAPFTDPGEYLELVSLVSGVEHVARSGIAGGIMPALPLATDTLYSFTIEGAPSAGGYRLYAFQNSGSTRDYHAQTQYTEV